MPFCGFDETIYFKNNLNNFDMIINESGKILGFLKKTLFFCVFFAFSSCTKCKIKYMNVNAKSSFLSLGVELSNLEIEGIEEKLTVYVHYKDLEFKNKYLDSIKVIPIYKKDTLEFESKNEPIYMFKANQNEEMDKLDVKVILYAKDYFAKNDTCLVFENLKRVKHCYTSTAFH